MNPFERLSKDWAAAKAAKDPNAPFCTLMTVDRGGSPKGRVVGLRDIRNGRLLVYTNSTSPKWQQLMENPQFEILLFWTIPHMLQYRLSGCEWSLVEEDTMREQWAANKPHRSKLLDYYYQQKQAQSSVLADGHESFVGDMQALGREFAEKEVPFQSANVGIWFEPSKVEEWRASLPDRMHERYLYEKSESRSSAGSESWKRSTLVA